MTIIALLDLSTAFNTVYQGILLQQLCHTYGIGGTVLDWLCFFFTERVQIVYFAGDQSSLSTMTCGVQRGNVSGPLLFSLYTADVVRIAYSFGIRMHCYEDDL